MIDALYKRLKPLDGDFRIRGEHVRDVLERGGDFARGGSRI